jgi:preprotein translocase subunit SecE
MIKPISQMVSFVRESRDELKKVAWPERDEIINFTIIVLVTVVIVSLFLWIIDSFLMNIMSRVIY